MSATKKTVLRTFLYLTLGPFMLGAALEMAGQSPPEKSLDQVQEMTLASDPGVVQHRLQASAALRAEASAGTWADPMLSFGVFAAPIETRNGPQQATASLMQPLPLFGATNVDAALHAERTARANILTDQTQAGAVHQATLAWWNWQLNAANSHLLSDELALIQDMQDLTKQAYTNGQADALALVLLDSELAHRKGLHAQAQANKQLWLQHLHLLSGDSAWTPQPGALVPEASGSFWQWQHQDTTLFFSERLAINAANIANLQEDLSQIGTKPQVSVGVQYFAIGPSEGTAPDAGQDAWLPSIRLSLPIHSKRNSAIREAATLRTQAAASQTAEARQQREFILQELQRRWEILAVECTRIEAQLELSEQAIALAETAYTQDTRDLEFVLRLYRKHIELELELLQLYTQAHSTLATLNLMQ